MEYALGPNLVKIQDDPCKKTLSERIMLLSLGVKHHVFDDWKPKEGCIYRNWKSVNCTYYKSNKVVLFLNNSSFKGSFRIKNGRCEIHTKGKFQSKHSNTVKFSTAVSNVIFAKECYTYRQDHMTNIGLMKADCTSVFYIVKVIDSSLVDKL